MKTIAVILACVLGLAGSAAAASAETRGNESAERRTSSRAASPDGVRQAGHARYDHKRQFTSGGCTVTRRWVGSAYKQAMDCKPGRLPKPFVFRPY